MVPECINQLGTMSLRHFSTWGYTMVRSLFLRRVVTTTTHTARPASPILIIYLALHKIWIINWIIKSYDKKIDDIVVHNISYWRRESMLRVLGQISAWVPTLRGYMGDAHRNHNTPHVRVIFQKSLIQILYLSVNN